MGIPLRLFWFVGATLAVALIGGRGSTSVSAPGFSKPKNPGFGVIFETQNPGSFLVRNPGFTICNNVAILIYNANVKAAF